MPSHIPVISFYLFDFDERNLLAINLLQKKIVYLLDYFVLLMNCQICERCERILVYVQINKGNCSKYWNESDLFLSTPITFVFTLHPMPNCILS